jgi:hypothetical protein
MILCHCTTIAPEVIKAEGLKPGEDSWKEWRSLLGPATPEENVVWLTTNCCSAGGSTKWAYHVVIASSDRKLVRFANLVRRGTMSLELDLTKQLLAWYVYFGTITPDRIPEMLGVDAAAVRRPKFWLQPNGNKAQT